MTLSTTKQSFRTACTDYIEANAGKKDYDVIRINSKPDNISNATIEP